MNGDNGNSELILTPSGAAFRIVRVYFGKSGRARFISHLDLNRTMTRALRRAGLPIWYTEGFNRHPYVTFAAPLSLGYEGERECMDVRLIEEVPLPQLVQRLAAVMPEGLTVKDAVFAKEKPGELAAAKYLLIFGCDTDTMAAFLAQPSITVEKLSKKKQVKTVELHEVLAGAHPLPHGEGTQLSVTLPCSGSNTVNPGLIAQALSLFAGREILCRVTRLMLLDEAGNEFA